MARVLTTASDEPEPDPLGGMSFRATPEAAAAARQWFWKIAEAGDLRCAVGDCELLLSELVTNAVLHSEPDEPHLVRVDAWQVRNRLRIDVHSAGPPEEVRMRRPSHGDVHGRGLLLVDALAETWSVAPGRHGGTVVSFLMSE